MYNKRNAGTLIISCIAAMSVLAGCGNTAENGTSANESVPAQTTTTTAANSAEDTKKDETAAADKYLLT